MAQDLVVYWGFYFKPENYMQRAERLDEGRTR